MNPLLPSDVAELARSLGLAAWAGRLADLAEAGIGISRAAGGDGAGPPRRSRFGGAPDLARGIEWPVIDGRPAAFVCQLALGEVPGAPSPHPERPRPLLSFFCALDPVTREVTGARVLSSAPQAELRRVRAEAPSLPETPVELWPEVSLPIWSTSPRSPLTPLGLGERDRGPYELLKATVEREQHPDGPVHRLLGHPRETDDDVLAEAALLARLERRDPWSGEQVADEAARWRLLLQVDSDESLGVRWLGGAACLFCIAADDLAAGRYDGVQAVLRDPG